MENGAASYCNRVLNNNNCVAFLLARPCSGVQGLGCRRLAAELNNSFPHCVDIWA